MPDQSKYRPCACTLEAPAPDCQRGQELWAAIDLAVEHAASGRELGRAEGPQIDATDAIEANQKSYDYHVASQNPTREMLFPTLETLYRILSDRLKRGQITTIDCPGYEERAAAETADIARMVAMLTEQALVPYVSPIAGPQAIMPLERDIAEHAQELAGAFFCHHPATPEASKTVTFVNIEPTEQGYRSMKLLFQQSTERHQADIENLQKIRQWLIEDGPDGEGPTELVAQYIDVLESIFDMQIEEIKRSMASCQEGVAELERCGY